MTKINREMDMDDLIISINDIDVDMNDNICKDVDLYGNQLKNINTNTDKITNNTDYAFDVLDSNNDTLVESATSDMLSDELDSITNSEIPNMFTNRKELYNLDSEEVDNFNYKDEIKYKNNSSNTSKKRKKKNKALTIAVTTVLVGATGVFAYKAYDEYRTEQIRLSELDKENLDLKLIIDTVDEYGGSEYQLNWKEIASVLSVKSSNYPQTISKDDILNTCDLFLNKEENKIGDLGYVVNNLDMKPKEKERIFNYYEDLSEYGYTPDKLKIDSPQMEFINSIKDGAFESYKKTGILPSITIAQAILESNWGNSNLVKESNNLFGIKADSSWKGEYVTFETKEFHDTMIKDRFRKYASKSESIMDHSEFLRLNSRYEEGGVFEAKTYKSQALALQESGYSTAQDEYGNKTYASMLEQLIRQYNLQILDWEAKYFSK